MNIYYRFESAEDVPSGRRMVLTAIFEPDPLDYLKTLFGLFRPLPPIREYEVEFFTNNEKYRNPFGMDICYWQDKSSQAFCSLDMCELLEQFYHHSFSKPGISLIGRI